jgi:hypothetical protein
MIIAKSPFQMMNGDQYNEGEMGNGMHHGVPGGLAILSTMFRA